MSHDDRYTVPALQRGLQLLQNFTRAEPEHTGASLARKLNMPRASVFRSLHTLEQMGFVERAADGVAYRIGLAVLRLGFEYLASMELVEHGRPVIEALSAQCGYSSHVVVRDRTDVVFVAKAQGRNASFHSIQVGARLPVHATVLGRILLTCVDLEGLHQLYPLEPLQRYTPLTPTTVADLYALVQQQKKQSYGVSQSGFETGISTIAAPVINDAQQVVAALNITIPHQRIDEAQQQLLAAQVCDAAAQLSQRISHLPAQHNSTAPAAPASPIRMRSVA